MCNQQNNNGGGNGHADLPKHVMEEMQKAKVQAARWQSEAMKFQNELNIFKNQMMGNGGSLGSGKGGGKKGKAKMRRGREVMKILVILVMTVDVVAAIVIEGEWTAAGAEIVYFPNSLRVAMFTTFWPILQPTRLLM